MSRVRGIVNKTVLRKHEPGTRIVTTSKSIEEIFNNLLLFFKVEDSLSLIS